MTAIGYTLSSEEHGPNDLVAFAAHAEDAGFDLLSISDHFHPWIDRQGESPFVWSVLGGVAQATRSIEVITAVTCPTIRIHPAIVAQAAATTAAMMPGRFSLGVGSGENLNEHILGDTWPGAPERLQMLEEAIDLMRRLWSGELVTHRSEHYTVEGARIYSLPPEPPPVLVAAAGKRAAELAGRVGDGLIGVGPDPESIETFRDAGGEGKPRYGQLHVCYHEDEAQARRIAHEVWPNTSIPGELGQELPLPRHFEQAAQMVSEDDVAKSVVCGPDPEAYLEQIGAYVDAGFDHVFLHQIGPDQDGFLKYFGERVLPKAR
jgi:coenzyme F420-dependent glucose-6-phosphate dehydrogenase